MPKKKGKKKKRKVLKLKGGKEASELTETIETEKGWVNVPTIDPVRGMTVTRKEGIRMERENRGGKLKYYKTLDAAVKAAKKRSKRGGKYRKKK
jgi:hypothetical protein